MIICSPQYGLKPASNAGGEVYDEMVLKGLANLDNKIVVILPHNSVYDVGQKNWIVYNLKFPFVHFSYLYNFVILPRLYKIHKETNFKILRVHSPYYVGIGAILFKILFARNIKLIANYYHFENKYTFNLIDRLIIKKFDLILTLSETTKKDIINKYHIAPEKIVVTLCGVAEKYCPNNQIDKKTNQQFTLSFCGLLIKRKNIDFLVQIIDKLRNENVSLNIIGDGPEFSKLSCLVNRLKLNDKIKFIGYVSEKKKIEILQLSNTFVFPSWQEGFGMSPVEAMACGIPTITSDKGSLPEVIGNGGICLPLNIDDWVAMILKLKNDKVFYDQMVSRAINRAKQFSWNAVVEKTNVALNKIYNEN